MATGPKKPWYEELFDIKGNRAYCKQKNCLANYAWGRQFGTSHPLGHYRERHPMHPGLNLAQSDKPFSSNQTQSITTTYALDSLHSRICTYIMSVYKQIPYVFP